MKNNYNLIKQGNDFSVAFSKNNVWFMLGFLDVKLKYQRSLLGPFWVTASTGILIVSMSLIYGKLFGLDWQKYMPFLGVSFVIWTHISTIINESSSIFIDNKHMLHNISNIYFSSILRMLWRNFIILFHNCLMIVLIFLYFKKSVSIEYFIVSFLATLIITINGFWISLLIGSMAARYRDVPPLVQSVIQVVFFLTPIMWSQELLADKPEYWWITALNPFFHYIEIFRSPLIDGNVNLINWLVVICITIMGIIISLLFFKKYKSRITMWL